MCLSKSKKLQMDFYEKPINLLSKISVSDYSFTVKFKIPIQDYRRDNFCPML